MRDFGETFERLLRDRDRDRRVTWTAFAILAMFFGEVDHKNDDGKWEA